MDENATLANSMADAIMSAMQSNTPEEVPQTPQETVAVEAGKPDGGEQPTAPPAEEQEFDLENFEFSDSVEEQAQEKPPEQPQEGETKTEEESAAKQQQDDDPNKPFSKREESLLLATSRGKRMLSAFKWYRELEQRIGPPPPIEVLEQAIQARNDMMELVNSFDNEPEKFIHEWFGPDQTGQIPPTAINVLSKIPEVILSDPKYAPAAEAIAAPILSRVVDVLYSRANEYQGDDRNRILDAASVLEYLWFKRSRLAQQTQAQNPAQAADPEKEQLRKQLEEMNRRLTEEQKLRVQTFENNLNSEIRKAVTTDVEQVFSRSGLKSRIPQSIYQAAVRDLVNQVMDAVNGSDGRNPINPLALQEYKIKLGYTKNRAAQGSPSTSDLVTAYRRMAQQAIRQLGRGYIADLVGQAKGVSAAAPQVPPNASAQPAPTSPSALPPQQPGEDSVDYMTRIIASGLGRV